ncbi:hypothetical protein QUB36_13510 [Microcoleus sp. AT8-B1]|uniref:hypothetical protein n=1 Tax=unclassified Microcoleus TaxID=2642155 RepID=UPI002FD712FA
MSQPAGVTVENSSLAITLGVKVGKWFSDIGSQIGSILSKGLLNIKNLLGNMVNGAKELFSAIGRGDWNIFKNWLKEDPIATAAGAVAVVLIGGVVVGAVAGGVAAIAAAVTGAGAIGGITLAGIMPGLVQGAVNASEVIYNFDFNKSDDDLLKELNQGFINFAGVAGESLGRALANFIVGGDKLPKLKIDRNAMRTLFLALEDESETGEEILQELSTIGWAVFKLARQALFSIGFMQFRKWAKQNVKTGIVWIDKAIASWGTGKPLIISEKVNEFYQEIEKDNAALGNFLENFGEGFGGGTKEAVIRRFVAYS